MRKEPVCRRLNVRSQESSRDFAMALGNKVLGYVMKEASDNKIIRLAGPVGSACGLQAMFEEVDGLAEVEAGLGPEHGHKLVCNVDFRVLNGHIVESLLSGGLERCPMGGLWIGHCSFHSASRAFEIVLNAVAVKIAALDESITVCREDGRPRVEQADVIEYGNVTIPQLELNVHGWIVRELGEAALGSVEDLELISRDSRRIASRFRREANGLQAARYAATLCIALTRLCEGRGVFRLELNMWRLMPKRRCAVAAIILKSNRHCGERVEELWRLPGDPLGDREAIGKIVAHRALLARKDFAFALFDNVKQLKVGCGVAVWVVGVHPD